MINVLHYIGSMSYGGIESQIIALLQHIDKNKFHFDFIVAAYNHKRFDPIMNKYKCTVYEIPTRREITKNRKKEINKFFQCNKKKYDIFHWHTPSLANIDIIKKARKYNIPVRVVHAHNSMEFAFFRQVLHYYNKQKIHKYATNFLACSDSAAKWIVPKNRYLLNDYETIYNGINTHRFIFNSDDRTEVRKKFSICDDDILYGHIGRFSKEKNHEFLIKVFNKLHSRNEHVKLLLVGCGKFLNKIKHAVEKLNLDDCVFFVERTNNPQKYYSAFDLFLLPSLHEGFPVSLIEAQVSGLPCVVSETITKEIAVTQLVDYVSLKSGINNWVNCIEGKTIKESRDFSEKLKEFDIINIVNKYHRFYENVTNRVM